MFGSRIDIQSDDQHERVSSRKPNPNLKKRVDREGDVLNDDANTAEWIQRAEARRTLRKVIREERKLQQQEAEAKRQEQANGFGPNVGPAANSTENGFSRGWGSSDATGASQPWGPAQPWPTWDRFFGDENGVNKAQSAGNDDPGSRRPMMSLGRATPATGSASASRLPNSVKPQHGFKPDPSGLQHEGHPSASSTAGSRWGNPSTAPIPHSLQDSFRGGMRENFVPDSAHYIKVDGGQTLRGNETGPGAFSWSEGMSTWGETTTKANPSVPGSENGTAADGSNPGSANGLGNGNSDESLTALLMKKADLSEEEKQDHLRVLRAREKYRELPRFLYWGVAFPVLPAAWFGSVGFVLDRAFPSHVHASWSMQHHFLRWYMLFVLQVPMEWVQKRQSVWQWFFAGGVVGAVEYSVGKAPIVDDICSEILGWKTNIGKEKGGKLPSATSTKPKEPFTHRGPGREFWQKMRPRNVAKPVHLAFALYGSGAFFFAKLAGVPW